MLTNSGSRDPEAGSHAQTVALLLPIAVASLVVACSQPAPHSAGAPTVGPPASAAPPMVIGKAPPGAIVMLVPKPPRTVPMPEGPAVMDQIGKQFVPGELFVRVGQPVEFRNTEDQAHNVIVRRSSSGANVFHVSTDPSDKYVHTFDRPGRYDVSCDLHLGMAATIIATTSPYYAVADANGEFSIVNVEAGSYTLTVLVGGENIERAIDVAGQQTQVSLPR